MADTLKDFKEYTLYPALWGSIDVAFNCPPFNMDFRLRGEKWVSPKHRSGEESHTDRRGEQTVINRKKPHLLRDWSEDRAVSLVDFTIEKKGCDFLEALKYLAECCGLTLPEADSEEYKAYEERQKKREKAQELFTAALYDGSNSGAQEVLSYLRNSRRWTDEEIKEAGLGYIDESLYPRLRGIGEELFSEVVYPYKPDSEGTETLTAGTTHRLTIPFRSGSRLQGFKVRDILSRNPKYKYLNSKGLKVTEGFLYITSGHTDITVVEGELDALHAQIKGAENVVATAGSGVKEGQLQDAIRRGVKRITLLFDNDERGRGFIQPSAEKITAQGLSCFVSYLTEGKDTDEYLSTHTLEDWRKMVNTYSEPFCVWQQQQTINRYADICTSQEGILTMKQREDFLREMVDLMNAPTTAATDRELLRTNLSYNAESLKIDLSELKEYADREYYRKEAKKRSETAQKASDEISRLMGEGRTDEALKVMRETSSTLQAQDKATVYAQAFSVSTPAEYEKLLSTVKDGIPTGYTFRKQNNSEEELTLNAGLSFIAGYRGHGKTSFLNNIALNVMKRNTAANNGGEVFYFSYEVDKARLIASLLNTYVNNPSISRNPLRTIQSYFKGCGARYFEGNQKESNYKDFLKKKDEFLQHLHSGALRVVDITFKAEELLRALKWQIAQAGKPSLICLDYTQLLYSENASRLRTEEMKRILTDIKDFANDEGLPVLMAAQTNRNIDSPLDLVTQNIGEAGDIERVADTIVGLYNLKELHPVLTPKEASGEIARAVRLAGYQALQEPLSKVEGKVFCRLMKRRYGEFPLDTILDWCGATGYFKPNKPEALTPQTVGSTPTATAQEVESSEDTPF